MLPKTAKDTKDSQSRLDFFLMFPCIGESKLFYHHFDIGTLVDGYCPRFSVPFNLETEKPLYWSMIGNFPEFLDLGLESTDIDLSFEHNCHVVCSDCNDGMFFVVLLIEH